jgi:hypothetical protein
VPALPHAADIQYYRCDWVAVASVCYHCGAAVWPEWELVSKMLGDPPMKHEMHFWNCPACGEWRVDFEHQEMGSGNSRRLRARLTRFVDHWRFAVPYYLRRALIACGVCCE